MYLIVLMSKYVQEFVKRIFRQHNSGVIVVPKEIMRQMDLKYGDHLFITRNVGDNFMIVSPEKHEVSDAKKGGWYSVRKAAGRRLRGKKRR